MKVLLLSFLIISFLPNIICAQIPGSPLKVSENQLKDNNNNTYKVKAINLNDYIECTYSTWGRYYGQDFSTVVSWLHTSDDYTRIKRMGFNTVRVNISPAHLDSFPNMIRIIQHIQWAKKDSLYIILAYFAPPGSTPYNGYYSDKNFYTSEFNKNKYRQQWGQIMKLCKDSNYSHVMYEFLNEPQIGYVNNENYPNLSAYWKRSIYKDLMLNLLDTMSRINDANRVVIINGLSYANADYRGFKYLKSAINRNNIVYSFHYYMPDFVFRGCNWNTANTYRNYTGYLETNNGWDTLSFTFSTNDLQNITQPQIVFSPHDQRGTYRVKYYEIKDNLTQEVKISLDLTNKIIITEGSDHYILDGIRRYYLGFRGTWGSSPTSNMYMNNNNSIAMTNTIKQDTGVSIGDSNWAAMVFANQTNPFTLTLGRNYTMKIIMDGDSLDDNGGFVIQFKSNDTNVVYQKDIQNLTYGNTNQIEKILSSHVDRITSQLLIMKKFSDEYKIPIFLGEFGIPIQQRENNTFKYFRTLMNKVDSNNFHWAYFDYREPHENNISLDSNYITLGLFSGRDPASNPSTTVCKIVNGINNGETSFLLGRPYKYYYNKALIDTFRTLLGGNFTPNCTPSEVGALSEKISSNVTLEQNFPNPFNPETIINYSLPKNSNVRIIVYDVLGKEVMTLVNNFQMAGTYSVRMENKSLSSGVYYYKLITDDFSDTKKMILVR